MMAFWILTRHVHCYGLGMEYPQNHNVWRTWGWWVDPWEATEHESTHWWMHNWMNIRRRKLWKAEPGWSRESMLLKGLSSLEPLPLHVSFCFLTARRRAASLFVTSAPLFSLITAQKQQNPWPAGAMSWNKPSFLGLISLIILSQNLKKNDFYILNFDNSSKVLFGTFSRKSDPFPVELGEVPS